MSSSEWAILLFLLEQDAEKSVGARMAHSVSARPCARGPEFDSRTWHPSFDFFPFSVA